MADPPAPRPTTLLDFPWVVVALRCATCGKRGNYRLARLVERFGAEAALDMIRHRFVGGCDRQTKRGLMPSERCDPLFVDLDAPVPPPPDMPPSAWGLSLVHDRDAVMAKVRELGDADPREEKRRRRNERS